MKNIIVTPVIFAVLLWMSAISSCTYIFFDQPQPVDSKNLRKIPRELQGSWKSTDEAGERIVINATSFKFFENDNPMEITLSDSIVLRKAKNCYVFNMKKRDWWEIVLVQKNRSGEITINYPLVTDLEILGQDYAYRVLDSAVKDSLYVHAEFESKSIAKLINAEGGGIIWLLKPDSTFESLPRSEK